MKPIPMCYKLASVSLIPNIIFYQPVPIASLNSTNSFNTIISNITTIVDLNLITASDATALRYTVRKTSSSTNGGKLYSGTVPSSITAYISVCQSSSCLLNGTTYNSAFSTTGTPTVSLVNDANIYYVFYLYSHNYLFYKYKTTIT